MWQRKMEFKFYHFKTKRNQASPRETGVLVFQQSNISSWKQLMNAIKKCRQSPYIYLFREYFH